MGLVHCNLVILFSNKAAAGTSFVRKSIESFLPATAKSMVLVDVMAYDGSPALAALEDARS